MPADTINDYSFYLYDLKVEVVCPPGKRILCGAKPGDHFTLQGEMLHLPPGQGISIYSLGMRRDSQLNARILVSNAGPLQPLYSLSLPPSRE